MENIDTQTSKPGSLPGEIRNCLKLPPEKTGAADTAAAQPPSPWCRRDGPNRVCLACGRNIKHRPIDCPSPQHQESFAKHQAYLKEYWRKNKARLLESNRRYRATHPQHKIWAEGYHRRWYVEHREARLAQGRIWEEANVVWRPPYLRKKALEYYYRNHEQAKARNRRSYQEHKPEKNKRRGQLLKAQRARDPGARLKFNFRTRLSGLLRQAGQKTFSISREVLLYSAAQLRAHLEAQFDSWMSWENYGTEWEVDHIEPCAHFTLTNLEECRRCFSLENLRPLAIPQNRSRFHEEEKNAAQRQQRGTPTAYEAPAAIPCQHPG